MSGPEPNADVIVLGCGVTGLALAHELTQAGKRVTVLENYDGPGGNHISDQIDGCSFDIGAIFFWSTSPMFQLFPEAAATWQPIEMSTGRITPDGQIRTYPIDIKREILSLPLSRKLSIGLEILYNRLFHRRKDNVRDFALRHMGNRLFQESGLEAFFERFCGRPADEIVYTFAEWRMRWVQRRTTVSGLASIILERFHRTQATDQSPLQCYARPFDGFPAMYTPVVDRLRAAGVHFAFGANLNTVCRTDGEMVVTGGNTTWTANRVINTMPLSVAIDLVGRTDLDPPSSSFMTTLYCRYTGDRGFDQTVLYNFRSAGLWKRVTMHSDYYGLSDGAQYFSVECTHRTADVSAQDLFQDFASTARDSGIFLGELSNVGSRTTSFAYPVLDAKSVANRERVMKALAEMGIESAGRQGAFQYIASSNLAIELAKQTLKEKNQRALSSQYP